MKRIVFLFLASILAATADRPNVILILSDDQSWNDYGFMGHEIIETPRLDRLAEESVTFTRGYVTVPLCRPSLASLFTGLHPHRNGITGNDLSEAAGGKKVPRNTESGAKLHQQLYDGFSKCPSLAGLLKDAGYLTLQTGKWWESDPKQHGFTHAMTHGDPNRGGRHGDVGLEVSRNGIAPIRSFLDEADKAKKPFFIWHAPFLPHTPHNPPKALFEKYKAKVDSPHVARYYAMVEWFDQTCGELFDELDKRGLTENTLVIYVTDNGWIQNPKSGGYAPLSKQDVHEGGVRTPIMLRWPGTLKPRMDKVTVVSSIDIPVTILEATGLEAPEAMTGLDLRDQKALEKRKAIFGSDYSHNIKDVSDRTGNLESVFVVAGRWKLILHNPANFPPPAYAGAGNGKPWNKKGDPELYQLLEDPWEKQNLADEHPEVLKELGGMLREWSRDFAELGRTD
ncbi:sulfatase [Haloferula sp. A504]|uniref:sulfatase n=1 Tax=Haloferula sp. A504 TaxID=3373601 RepID=UPI0031BF6763|nr:sulfatase [Verrucomicrobiaceae bacterium E54]